MGEVHVPLYRRRFGGVSVSFSSFELETSRVTFRYPRKTSLFQQFQQADTPHIEKIRQISPPPRFEFRGWVFGCRIVSALTLEYRGSSLIRKRPPRLDPPRIPGIGPR